jgi:hypothetical protein
MGAGARHFVFMLKGLQELAPKLEAHGIPFFLLQVGSSSGCSRGTWARQQGAASGRQRARSCRSRRTGDAAGAPQQAC